MSRVRFLADEDVNAAIITGLLHVEPRIKLLRVREVGLAGRPDPEVLEHAAGQDLVVVSHDINTMTAHASYRIKNSLPMPGLVVVPQRLDVGLAIKALNELWETIDPDELRDVIWFV